LGLLIVRKWSTRFLVFVVIFPFVLMTVCGSAPAHADPSNDQGCWCHNNNVGVVVNGTDWCSSEGYGIYVVSVNAGGSFGLQIQTTNDGATGFADTQQWVSSLDNNSQFLFNPQSNFESSNGVINTLYTITAPAKLKSGWYTITLVALGFDISFLVMVTGGVVTSEFSNASIVLTLSAIGIIIVFAAMRTRKPPPES